MNVRIASAALAPRRLCAKQLLDADPAGDRRVKTKAELLVETLRREATVQVDPVDPVRLRHRREAAHGVTAVSLAPLSLGADEVVHEEVLSSRQRVRSAHARERDEEASV